MTAQLHYELRCRECRTTWGNQPISFCQKCFAPLEVVYDLRRIREQISKDEIARRAPNLWRYRELLPLPGDFDPSLPAGFTPLLKASGLGDVFHTKSLYLKNDAVCFPSLSFKDRVVAVALAQARNFGFDIVSCSSTGNLANAVAAQAARGGFRACIFIPADLEQAKVLGTQVYGARIVRIAGNYDQVNRLCSQIADKHRWGFVNVNLRPYYAEGSKTVGYEIAEQLGWRLPDNVVVPIAGGWAEDASDPEIVDAMTLLAETEGVFTETAGGVTVSAARKLYAQKRIRPEETTVRCITGNGLKTTDALAGKFEVPEPIAPKLAAFEEYLEREAIAAPAGEANA